MARKRAINLRCPTCKKPVKNNNAEFPFCSDRCRRIDLGRWLGEKYRIPGLNPSVHPEGDADADAPPGLLPPTGP